MKPPVGIYKNCLGINGQHAHLDGCDGTKGSVCLVYRKNESSQYNLTNNSRRTKDYFSALDWVHERLPGRITNEGQSLWERQHPGKKWSDLLSGVHPPKQKVKKAKKIRKATKRRPLSRARAIFLLKNKSQKKGSGGRTPKPRLIENLLYDEVADFAFREGRWYRKYKNGSTNCLKDRFGAYTLLQLPSAEDAMRVTRLDEIHDRVGIENIKRAIIRELYASDVLMEGECVFVPLTDMQTVESIEAADNQYRSISERAENEALEIAGVR